MTNLTDLLTKFMNSNTASTLGSGSLPSNTITNPKVDLKGITTQSGVAYQGPTIPITSSPLKVVEHEPEVTKDTVLPTNNGIVDFDANPRVPLILERSFLKTGHDLIDVYEGELTLRIGKEAVTFNLDQTLRYSSNYDDNSVNRINVIEMACEEYSQKILGFFNMIMSGNPTPYYDLVVSTSSPTLTPFGDSDFLLEEVDAFLALEDDPTSPRGFERDYYYDRYVVMDTSDGVSEQVTVRSTLMMLGWDTHILSRKGWCLDIRDGREIQTVLLASVHMDITNVGGTLSLLVVLWFGDGALRGVALWWGRWTRSSGLEGVEGQVRVSGERWELGGCDMGA
ncbi:hypothetical protein Tco_0004990 [Tanacetum coccineum]